MATIREKIIERIEAIDDLPSGGPQLLEAHKYICENKQDANAVAAVIEKDLQLAAKILRVANSVLYSARYGEIGDLSVAIARLGMDEICRISMAFKAVAVFNRQTGIVSPEELWHHSIAVAMVTRNIVSHSSLDRIDSGMAYMAGLMHDIGIFILDYYFPEVYKKVREAAALSTEMVFEIEKKLLGIEHGEIGGLILERWHFPEEMVNSVKFHNYPDESNEKNLSLTQIVHIADFACAALGAGEPGESVPQRFSLGAWHDLGISTDSLKKIVEETEEEIARAKILFKIN